MDRRDVYLDEPAIRNADTIIEAGFASSVSAAIRLSLAQMAKVVRTQPTS